MYGNDTTFSLITDAGENLTLIASYFSDPILVRPVLGLLNMTSVVGNPLRDHDPMFDWRQNSSPVETFAVSDTSMIITKSFTSDRPLVYSAFKCNLHLCMKEYFGSVAAGKLVETTSQTTSTGWREIALDEEGYINIIGFSRNLSDGRYARVGIEGSTVEYLSDYLGAGLHGLLTTFTTPGPFAGSGVSDGGILGWTNDIIQGIWSNNQSDVSQTFQNIAASLTTNIRLQSGQRAVGTAHSPIAFIHVRWIYMVLPITMVMLAVLFNLLVTWRSRVCEVSVWRTNAMADVVYAGGVVMDISTPGTGDGAARPEVMLTTSALETWAEGKVARLRFRARGNKGRI